MIRNLSFLRRQVKREEAEAFAVENGLTYIEASAKTSDGVDEAFLGTARRIWEKLTSGQGGLVRRTTMLGDAVSYSASNNYFLTYNSSSQFDAFRRAMVN